MRIPVFVSCPKPFLERQEQFSSGIEEHLRRADFRPVTLGRNEYSMDAPLVAIRKLMAASYGLITLAFRKTYIAQGMDRPDSDVGEKSSPRSGVWLSSPYCQIEPAMGYQRGLPILVWREAGVLDDGLLDRGATELSMPEFDLDDPPQLHSDRWKQPLAEWTDRVRSAYNRSREVPQPW